VFRAAVTNLILLSGHRVKLTAEISKRKQEKYMMG